MIASRSFGSDGVSVKIISDSFAAIVSADRRVVNNEDAEALQQSAYIRRSLRLCVNPRLELENL